MTGPLLDRLLDPALDPVLDLLLDPVLDCSLRPSLRPVLDPGRVAGPRPEPLRGRGVVDARLAMLWTVPAQYHLSQASHPTRRRRGRPHYPVAVPPAAPIMQLRHVVHAQQPSNNSMIGAGWGAGALFRPHMLFTSSHPAGLLGRLPA